MATYTPNAVGSAGNDPSVPTTIILNAASTDPSILDVKGNPTARTTDNNARINETLVTVAVTALGAIESIVDCGGQVGVNPAYNYDNPASGTVFTLSVGDVFYIDGAGDPIDNGYQVLSISGSTYCTETTYDTCYALNNSGIAYTYVGTLSPVAGSVVAGDAWCVTPLGVLNQTQRVFQNYKSRVYTNCWECFDGSISPCDITTTTVTLWTDQAPTGSNVVYADGSKTFQGDNLSPGADNVSGENLPT